MLAHSSKGSSPIHSPIYISRSMFSPVSDNAAPESKEGSDRTTPLPQYSAPLSKTGSQATIQLTSSSSSQQLTSVVADRDPERGPDPKPGPASPGVVSDSSLKNREFNYSALWPVYIISAIQPTLNAWNAGDRLMFGGNCSLGDFSCYGPAAWQDGKSIVVWLFVVCTFLDNVAISRVFMPDTLEMLFPSKASTASRTWLTWFYELFFVTNLFKVAFESLKLLSPLTVLSFLFSASCSLITYKLSIDSLTIFRSLFEGRGASLERFGYALDVIMLFTAVLSTFATRMVGCESVFANLWLWWPYTYVDQWLPSILVSNPGDIENKRIILNFMHQCSLYEYNATDETREAYLDHMINERYTDAVACIKKGNLLAKPSDYSEIIFRKSIQVFKVLCYFFALACYPVIYNITAAALTAAPGSRQLSYVVALPNILFYTYALSNLADQAYRTCKLHFFPGAPTGGLLTVLVLAVLTIFGSANLLATALVQVKKGGLDDWLLPHDVAQVLFPIILASISGLTNGFGLARIDRIFCDQYLIQSNLANKKWSDLITGADSGTRQMVSGEIQGEQSNAAQSSRFFGCCKANRSDLDTLLLQDSHVLGS